MSTGTVVSESFGSMALVIVQTAFSADFVNVNKPFITLKSYEKGRLFAMNNKISSLVLPAKLATLNVSNNKLTFETLPSTSIATNYTYNNQKPMVVTAAEGKVDLSSQAMVDNVETVYVWTSGTEEIN